MKRSNKILIGGALFPFVLFLGFIIFMSVNSTDIEEYKFNNHLGGNELINFTF